MIRRSTALLNGTKSVSGALSAAQSTCVAGAHRAPSAHEEVGGGQIVGARHLRHVTVASAVACAASTR